MAPGREPGRPTGGCKRGTAAMSVGALPPPSSCHSPPPVCLPSLTWLGIRSVGRGPPENLGDMKGWKKWARGQHLPLPTPHSPPKLPGSCCAQAQSLTHPISRPSQQTLVASSRCV